MTLPSADVQEQPAGPSLAPSSSARAFVTFGCSSKGPLFTPTPIGVSLSTLTGTFGCGPGVKAHAYNTAQTGAQGIFIRLPATAVAAYLSAVDTTGIVGGNLTPTVSGTPLDGFDVVVVFTVGGTVGVAGIFYKVSTDGGRTFGNATALGTATSINLTSSVGVTITLTAAQTVSANDSFEFYTLPASQSVLPATVTRVNTSTATLTPSGTPNDAYEIRVEFLTSGTVGTAGITYRYSLDGGRTFTAALALGVANSIALSDGSESSGVSIALGAGTLDGGDKITFNTTGPEWQGSDASTGLTALRSSNLLWSFLHGVGTVDASKAGTIGSILAGWAAKTKFAFAMLSARDWGSTREPETSWITRLLAAWNAYSDTRIAIGAGYGRITCPVTGRQNRRPVTWPAVSRVVSVNPQVDLAQKSLGSLSSDVRIHDTTTGALLEHDARINSALHDGRFITFRTYEDEPGVFFTRGNLMGPSNDIQRLAYRRVLNIVNEVYQKAMIEQLESPFRRWGPRVKAPFKPGDIHEADAKRIELAIKTALRSQVVATGMVSDIEVRLNRTPISIGPGQWRLECDVKITGLGYIDNVVGRVGFIDPVLDALLNK
jgi:hypothetical protein